MIGTKEQAVLYIMELPQDAKVEVKPWKPKRTNQQNSYYWSLLTQIANRMKLSKTAVHNLMLRDYGQPIVIGGEKHYSLIPDTDEAAADVLNQEEVHLKPTSYVQNKGDKLYRAYCTILGSRYYNTKEMGILLDGCIQEAQSLGIQTLPPNEIERMRQADELIEKRRLAKRNTG